MMPGRSIRKACVHSACQRSHRSCRPHRSNGPCPVRFRGNCRTVAAAAASDPYGSRYDGYNDYDDVYAREAIIPAAEDPMKILLEEFDLDVNTLFEQKAPAQSDYQSWESTPLGEDSNGMDEAWMTEEYEEDSVLIEAEEEEYDADDVQDAQMAFAFEDAIFALADVISNSTRAHGAAAVQEKAFELHHGQMARSVNPYATTLFYANVLEDMSKIDEAGETSDIPAWIRALYVMERNFDGWNEVLREKLLASQVALAKNYKAQKLAEYRESVSELNGDFDYSQLTFATEAASAAEEAEAAEEDVSGAGDALDPLLDVLPGVSGADAAQAAQYASELMLPGGLVDDEGDEEDGTGTDGEEGRRAGGMGGLEEDDDDDSGEAELDF